MKHRRDQKNRSSASQCCNLGYGIVQLICVTVRSILVVFIYHFHLMLKSSILTSWADIVIMPRSAEGNWEVCQGHSARQNCSSVTTKRLEGGNLPHVLPSVLAGLLVLKTTLTGLICRLVSTLVFLDKQTRVRYYLFFDKWRPDSITIAKI